VTAVDGRLDVQVAGGASLGRGLALDAKNQVQTEFRVASGNMCAVDGINEEFDFKYTFAFNINGTGSATVTWSYGTNAHCAVCMDVMDTATLLRVAGPGG
jgi:hypothetical protein